MLGNELEAKSVKETILIDDVTPYYGTPYPLSFYPDSFKKPMTRNL
jgi:hypothetical protein